MRAIVVGLMLLTAPPAAAQAFGDPATQAQLEDLRLQQQLAQQRAVAQENEMRALETRLAADRAVAELRSWQTAAPLPTPPYPDLAAPINPDSLPAIPDEMLAKSNARVREALKNRR